MLKILGWVLLGLLLFVFFLLLLPVRTRVCYDGTVQIWCGLGPVSMRVFPLKKANKKAKPQKEKAQAAEKKKEEEPLKNQKPKKKLTPEIICDFLRLGAEALGTMRRRLVIQNLTCHLKVASGDAAGTALLYGRTAAAVSSLYPVLERNLRIKKTDIAVDADFEGTKMDILTDITLAVCPLRLMLSAAVLLIHFLKINQKMKQHNQPIEEKGGNVHEQH